MQETQINEETCLLKLLIGVEDLVEKKAKIYSRLLTDVTLAEGMQQLSQRHTKRRETLEKLISGKPPKKQTNKEIQE